MFLLRLIMIVIVGLLGACAVGSSSEASTKRLTESDSGGSIQLHLGDKLEVTLPANPTTGFQWEVSAGNAAILQPNGAAEFQPSSSALGGGGNIIFRFQAVGTGQMPLKLVYHRPFEQDVPPVQTFEVSIIVR
ncbi:MAG TPA: protease inhibitor I42 family protein [Anaerolineales bacterium]|nr:protease inhibitor I42 family protein [Anaerolineales bacterium]